MQNFRALRLCSNLIHKTISFPYNLNTFANCRTTFAFYSTKRSRVHVPPELPKRPPTEYKQPVDWLPFKWHRKPYYNLFEDSGDFVKENVVDMTMPRPDFELSDELKTADERVKLVFSLQTGTRRDKKAVAQRLLLEKVQRHPTDMESLEAKIALMTIKVRALFEHTGYAHRRDVTNCRVRLHVMIGKRNKLLNELKVIDYERFLWVLDQLQLYYRQQPMSLQLPRYNKKFDLRRLTKEYCEKTVTDKKAAYHEELRAQQADFLEEKKKILEWIAEEEKALQNL